MKDPTKGDEPIVGVNASVVINGETYAVRRLGVRDTFTIARIIASGAAALRQPLTNQEIAKPDKLAELLMAGLMTAEAEAMRLLSSVIGVTPKELEDATRFPMGAELTIIEALADHQDLRAFFAQAVTLMRRLPEMRTRLPEASI